jgi:heat shock protein HslJ
MNRRTMPACAAAATLALTLAACSNSQQDSTQEATATASGQATTTAPEETTVAPEPSQPDQSAQPDQPVVPAGPAAFTGTWHDPDGGGVLTFADDGTVTGTDGCNGLRSTWTLTDGDGGEGSTATVDGFVSTMMACPGPWSAWLVSAGSFHHDGDHLTVNATARDGGTGGVELGRLEPVEPA